MSTQFSDFDLHPKLLHSLDDLGFSTPTPIQTKSLPDGLAGRDLQACAMTGSGKTAAFLLPILQHFLNNPGRGTRALVVTPTRELASQVREHFELLAKYSGQRSAAIFGGVKPGPQERALRAGVDLVVATPGRLLDHLKQDWFSLNKVEVLVLDEADRMLDMGFLPDVRRILAQVPKTRQTLLFSATMPAPIVKLSRELLNNPVAIDIARPSAPATGVRQTLWKVPAPLKSRLLVDLIKQKQVGTALVFTRTKHRANRLAAYLDRAGLSVDRIHGNRSQRQREMALAGFKNGSIKYLVATDIAARGIDIANLPYVINFDVPVQAEDYIHRVGRTARASSTGDAWTLASRDEAKELAAIERALHKKIPNSQLENFDYDAAPNERLEIPIGERIAAIRARKAEERARSRAKAALKAEREASGGHRAPRRRAEKGPQNPKTGENNRPRNRSRRR